MGIPMGFPQGAPASNSCTFRAMELTEAKAAIEEDTRKTSGQAGGRVRFAQHQRGDGPGVQRLMIAGENDGRRFRRPPRATESWDAASEWHSPSGID
jgi:hypothetical protein